MKFILLDSDTYTLCKKHCIDTSMTKIGTAYTLLTLIQVVLPRLFHVSHSLLGL